MKLIYQVKEFGAFLLVWGFVGVPITLFAYFDTEWSRYFWIGVVVLYTFTLVYAYIFKKTGEDKTVDLTSRNSEHINFDDTPVDGNLKNEIYPSKKSQACFLVGSLSGLFSAVFIVTLLDYIFEKEITVVSPLLIIFLILISGIIGISLIYLSTKL